MIGRRSNPGCSISESVPHGYPEVDRASRLRERFSSQSSRCSAGSTFTAPPFGIHCVTSFSLSSALLSQTIGDSWLRNHLIPLTVLTCLVVLTLAVAISLWRLSKRHNDLSTDLEAVVDERTRAVRTLRETEVLYHSLVETLPQLILRKNLDGQFTFANQRFCSELGRSLGEIVGKTDFDFFPRELAEKYRRDDRRVIESGEVLDVVEQHITPKQETLYVQTMKTPLYGVDGKPIGVQAIFWDVTARIRADEQLKEQNVVLQELAQSKQQAHEDLKNAQSRLVQTEKMASLGQLVAGVAHEINNPLSFVSNNVAVLERDLRDLLGLIELYRQAEDDLAKLRPDLVQKITDLDQRIDLGYSVTNLPRLIERTREGLRRIERIVKELRLFARVDEGDWNEVDLNPGIESSINMVKGYARKKGVRIVMDLGAMPVICCRAAQNSSGDCQPLDQCHRRLRRRGRRGHGSHRNRARGHGRANRYPGQRLRH